MKRISSYLLIAGCVVASFCIGAWHDATYAQVVQVTPVPARVFSGQDMGFKMTGRRGNVPVGVVVVRIDNEWVEVDATTGAKLITR